MLLLLDFPSTPQEHEGFTNAKT